MTDNIGSILPSKPPWIESTILRANNGMIRDCWWDKDYFCIRQTKYNEDGSEPAVKIIRLAPEEWRIIYTMLGGKE